MTTAQVAVGFGVSESTVRNWVMTGKITPAQKANLRGDHRFSSEEVARFARVNGLVFAQPATEVGN